MSLLEALSPTVADLLNDDVHFYTCTYTKKHFILGEVVYTTVITGTDERAALESFKSRTPGVTSAKIVSQKEVA
jgi:carbamoylphosphate synthase small subunit